MSGCETGPARAFARPVRQTGIYPVFRQRYLGCIAMAYRATIIPVMIASPSDVKAERRIVREVLHEWNDVNSISQEIAFMPVAWETHASPGLDGRPQEMINKHLLRDCDLLVGVFWTRLGTPTGASPSGTVEEIREHHAAGKPVMLYFSSAPVSPGEIDEGQYSKVEEFKAWSKGEGLIKEYDSENQFREEFSKHIDLILQRNEYLQRTIGELSPITIDSNEIENSGISLSTDAQELLLAAAKNEDNCTIFAMNDIGGYSIQAGTRSFGGDSRREEARWKRALDELVGYGFVEGQGYKGEVFELTHTGWEEADRLRAIAGETDGDGQ